MIDDGHQENVLWNNTVEKIDASSPGIIGIAWRYLCKIFESASSQKHDKK